MSNIHKKLVVVVGPTASGKSALAICIAQKYNGEILSADSRQVYKNMDIGSGKIMKKEMHGIPHHLLDIAHPSRRFTVLKYQSLAYRTLHDIWQRGKLPILCGGAGLYIHAVVDGVSIPKVKPNYVLRKKLGKQSTSTLFAILKKKDPQRALNIDPHNPRRLIRALEIVYALGKVPPSQSKPLDANILFIGIKKDSEKLKKLITKRLHARMKQGMIQEVSNLHYNGVSWKRLEDFGLEYRYIAQFLQKKITRQEMLQTLKKEIYAYAKRQMTWFKKEKRIHWIHTLKETESFLKSF